MQGLILNKLTEIEQAIGAVNVNISRTNAIQTRKLDAVDDRLVNILGVLKVISEYLRQINNDKQK